MKVLITDGTAPEAVKMLEEAGHEVVLDEASPERLLEIIGEYDALIVRSRTKVRQDALDRAVRMKVIGRAGIGVDNIDVKYAKEKGIKVVNAPLGSTLSVAELALSHMLALARGLVKGTNGIRSQQWLKKQLKGMELDGKTVGIIGCGRIGQALASRCQAFGMTTIGYDPYLPAEVAGRANIRLVELDDLYRTSDFISLHVALTDETRHMISKPQLDMMKKNAYVINCARGGVVDEEALYNALKEGRIGGAGLDVFETEPPGDTKFAELDNVTMTPHIGANTVDAQFKAGTMVSEQVIMALKGETPTFWVNK
ncbi:MAG: phosphoglycerate dehydrogenase [Candidatus Thermoplasmatota archaeon]|nr:phosphoglycerate dehydrogenase [Candidatus Thermoplasmatota archaeon]